MKKNKKIFLTILILLYSQINLLSEINIIAVIDDKIITNYDIQKEINYLEILNPNLINLTKDQKISIAKKTLIKEIIKSKEINKKITNLDKENFFTKDQFKQLYSRLNYSNEEEFEKDLKKKNNYSINEIKNKIDIELNWNELIYSKYINQVKIDKKKLLNKIENYKNEKFYELNLSEIIFKKEKDSDLDKLFKEIELSINEIGFNNTANIYSISDTSKFGGNIGWINENSFSDNVKNKLNHLKVGERTEIFGIGNNFLILKLNDRRLKENLFDKDEELEKLINEETNTQLNKFSKIYFDKIAKNYSINEN